jgi:hypothetical protein
MRIREEFGVFQIIWREKHSDLRQWFYYNIFIGLSPIWLSWVPLVLGLVFTKFHRPFLDGSILVFAVTLSGASLAFFAEDTRRELRETKRFLLNWLFFVILTGSAGFTAITAEHEFFPNKLSPWVIGITSLGVFLAAIFLNFHLAAVRLAYSDDSLIQRIVGREPEQLVQEARRQDEIDGTRL